MTRGKNKMGVIILTVIILLIAWSAISLIPVTGRFSLDLLDGETANVRMLLITDLHSCKYGRNQSQLIEMVKKEAPDIIMFGGDIFDDRLPDDNAQTVVRQLSKLYPCYYVTGNHEYRSGQMHAYVHAHMRADYIKSFLRDEGVRVLEGDCETLLLKGCAIDICGVDDPAGTGDAAWKDSLAGAYAQTDSEHLRVLLTHRPERVSAYEQYDFDLILAGHAHAGQIRIPFFNRGLLAPNQGFFAKYVSGIYTLSNGSVMAVSRGLARESTPFPRFFNHPEIVVLDIH